MDNFSLNWNINQIGYIFEHFSTIHGEISSTQTLQSKTAEAFLANWCAAAFASLCVWVTFHALKQCMLNFTPSMTFDMDHGTEFAFVRADTTSLESLSILCAAWAQNWSIDMCRYINAKIYERKFVYAILIS